MRLLRVVLVPLFFSLALSASLVTHLPGFNGPLPFSLETGYVTVDEVNGVELFYYFIESEGSPKDDPLLLWNTGGPGCSALSALAFEVGPLKIRKTKYNGSLPTMYYNPHSWTKLSNILFLDSPVGTGFSFSRLPEGCEVGDKISSIQVYKFLLKWFVEHPQFLSNPLYIAGDSYGGKIVMIVTQEVVQGIDAGIHPLLNLKGYLLGNPVNGEKDCNARVPFAHGMGILSDEIYELATKNCEGEDYRSPTSAQCATILDVVNEIFSEINDLHVLEPHCNAVAKPRQMIGSKRSLKEKSLELLMPPEVPEIWCRYYTYHLAYHWANDREVREALHIKKGTVNEWHRCKTYSHYSEDIQGTTKYHHNITTRGYRALVYSGDHDLSVPFLGTQGWIRSLNFSVVDEWRSWHVRGQVAGYTRTYSNNLTFATVKNAGHTAPEYRPKECLAMFRRWISYKPL